MTSIMQLILVDSDDTLVDYRTPLPPGRELLFQQARPGKGSARTRSTGVAH